MNMPESLRGWLKIIYVGFAFCSALFLGALKGLLVGPIAALILIVGNNGVILGMLPAHVFWTVQTLLTTERFDIPLKVAVLFALPALFGIWLALSIAGSFLVGIGHGFITPWVSSFEAFRHDRDNEPKKFLHCVVDGTWETIIGSCTVVRDFKDICCHSYPLFLKEIRDQGCSNSNEQQPLRLIHVPSCIIVGVMGLLVEIPLYTAIAVIKSPYMLFKGWFRLTHDMISREGPFLETACIPIAGLAILLWPIVVVGSILVAVFASVFVGLYGSIVVYQERSFRRGVAYVIAMVAEFDEYTNDWLYLREGTIFPKPQYRKKKVSSASEFSSSGNHEFIGKIGSVESPTVLVPNGNPTIRGKANHGSGEAPAMLVPSLAHSRSVRKALQEVKMVQIWESMMRSCELRGKELLDTNVITVADLYEWQRTNNGYEASIIGVGLPCYSFLHAILYSIKAGLDGFLLLNNVEINYFNRPQDKLLDWFFHPVMVLKEQIRVLQLDEGEVRFLEKLVLFGSNLQRREAWDNGSLIPEQALRNAQIQGITRRMVGMMRSVSKLPTYRRRFRNLVKGLLSYSLEKEGITRTHSSRPMIRSHSMRSDSSSIEVV